MSDRSVIFIRTSTKDQNPRLQLDECLQYCQSKGWENIKVFEKWESAYKNEEGVWKEEIEWAIANQIRHIVVWNMDRFSRLPEERVLDQVKILATMHNLKIHAVRGDAWSDLAESIGKLNDMGFVGKAINEFLETLIRGMEHSRAHRESQTKSERVKLAVRRGEGVTKSYKGKKWGRPTFHTNKIKIILDLRAQGKSYSEISKEAGISKGAISNILNRSKKEEEKSLVETPSKEGVVELSD